MKLLTFSTLFPNTERPQHGIFVQSSLRHLVASGNAEARVVAPVPWFPFRHAMFGEYGALARVPAEEIRIGVKVVHPRYPLPPRFGMNCAPWLLAQAVKPAIRRILDDGYDFDAIDAHYFYPDGVAAVMLGRHFDKPVVVTALGSDINVLPRYRLPRAMILWAAQHAAATITVSHALRKRLIALGADGGRIVTMHNGVDLRLFAPLDRERQRRTFGLREFTLLSVGNLIAMKGHHRVIKALTLLPDVNLLVAGRGPEAERLQALAQRLGVAGRVRFLGSLPQDELRMYYGAADALVLASRREGCANVLLESMACGTPVIASKVGGNPEIVRTPQAGLILPDRSPEAIAGAVRALRKAYPDRAATRRYAEQFGWEKTTAAQLQLFRQVCGKAARMPAGDRLLQHTIG